MALIEDGDTIVVDINKDRLNCQKLDDTAVYAKPLQGVAGSRSQNGGVHPKVNAITIVCTRTRQTKQMANLLLAKSAGFRRTPRAAA